MSTEIIKPALPGAVEDDAYNEKMLEKADAGLGSKPEEKLLAGKYKTEEDLQKGVNELLKRKHNGSLEDLYKELEREFNGKSADAVSGKKDAKPDAQGDGLSIGVPGEDKPNDVINGNDNASDADSKAGGVRTDVVPLDFDKYSDEYATHGGLSEDSIAEIGKAGIPAQIVAQYVEGLKALTANAKSHAYNLVGGEGVYQEMIQWAKATLKPAEIIAFNEGVNNTDLEKRGGVIASLFAKYQESNPSLIDGELGGDQTDVYNSIAEMSADMRDPRYKKDHAFRQLVADKLNRSKIM